jgi:DNA topoisomerase-1
MSSLVVVESPAKARTVSRFLGPEFTVEASYGHIRDLPESADEIPKALKKESWARLGVNVEEDFEPVYVISSDKKKHVQRLKKALAGADRLVVATDEDREGESIGWHVVEILQPEVPVERIAFHEITEQAIKEALSSPRGIDQNLVRAQESRRILDRLFGYELSPVLWKKVRTGLSAGRVQSVAVRLCVLRERRRWRFRSARWWDVEAELESYGTRFTARLVRLDGQRLATGQDFDPDRGTLTDGSSALWLADAVEAQGVVDGWHRPWRIASVEEKPLERRPAPPFVTASLQQEANRKLRFAARHTMRVAQRLYEGVDLGHGERTGLITYMRTDSVTLSGQALRQAAAVIRDRYGNAYYQGPRRYTTKTKGAQEAHEAIRPTSLSRTPESVARYLNRDELALYELIWRRALASQMTNARLKRTTVEIVAPATPEGRDGVFTATGKVIEFPGFLRAYVEGSDDPEAEIADREELLPKLEVDQDLDPRSVEPKEHETTAPARYTEASLVKRLESEGIGRPSTYATIIDTIQERGYVVHQGNVLVPTFVAFAVTELLERHFADYVDTGFTARMEEQLDDIAAGELDWKEHLERFWLGNGDRPGLRTRISREQDRIDYPAIPVGSHPENGQPIVVRMGRYGPYLQWEREEGDRVSASLPADLAPADLTLDKAVELLDHAESGPQELGRDPDTGLPVFLDRGRYGPYVQLGQAGEGRSKPKRASLPRGVSMEDVGLDLALRLLSLPRVLGEDPETREEVIAHRGRFGPFVKRGDETRSLTSEDDVYTIGLERARELLAQPKGGRRRRVQVLRELGEDDQGRAVQLREGPYGAYLTNGELNAGLPKGTDPKQLGLQQALQILREKGKPPKRRRRRKKG